MENVKLNFLHVCENAFVSQSGNLNIIEIFDQINANNFPAAHPKLAIVSSFSGEIGKYKETIEIVSPEGSIIAKVEKDEIEIVQSGGVANFIANFIGLIFSSEGKYKIRVTVNDQILSEDKFILLKSQ